MKQAVFLSALIIALTACNEQPKPAASPNQDTTAADTPKMRIQIPNSACYLHVSGKDSIALKVEVFPNVVTGALRYGFHEKDASKGEIEGKLMGDTLLADYTFTSEGKRSVRQVIFLIKDSIATEGYGDMEEKNGKMVFKNPAAIDFSKGLVLHQISCLDYDPASQLYTAAPLNTQDSSKLAGSWELNYISGPRIAFEGLYPNKKPFMLFDADKPDQVSGNTGCNNFRGKIQANKGNIHFDDLISTKMACPGDGERVFVDMLKKVNRYNITEDTFTLLIGDVAVMRFKKR